MDSYVEVFESLENGSIDAGITNKDFGNAYEVQYAVKKTPIIFQPIRLQFAFLKDSSLTPYLIERIDYHLKKLKADGNSIYYQSLEKWLTVEPIEKSVISRQVLWILIGLGGLAFVLIEGSFALRARVRSKTRELRQQIAERQQAEEALRESEEQFRAIFETAQDSIFIKDCTLKYTQVNPAMEKLFKLQSSKLIGLTDEDLFSDEAASHIREVDSRVLGGEIIDEEHAKPVKGIPYTFHLIKVPLRNSSGEIIGLCGIARDITERARVKEKLKNSFLQLARAASRAMETQDPYTVGHQRQVAELAKRIGEKMGLDQDRLSGLYIGGLLHDIGKIAIPSEILTQPGKLREEEWGIIRSHPQRGYEILKETDFPWPVADMVLHHHERLDGSGYPDGLKDGELSLEVRILGVCDVVDALSSDRPYRPARPQRMVIEEILSGRGTKYDEKVVDIMLEILEGGEPIE
jgi:PAS domain S-box-containing protein/putative nucleotidyltransferase with HDIG domain